MNKNVHTDWSGDGNSIWKTLGASNHTDKEREANDYYATSPEAIDKWIMAAEDNDTPLERVWECAAGAGHLSERLKQLGYTVYSTDIKDRGYPLDRELDFLTATKADAPFDNEPYDILTNPPYKKAKEFVLKGLELLPKNGCLFMFLKLTFLEGKARYNEIFSKTPPQKVYVFSERIMCAKNGEFDRMREGGGSAVAYAWFVWHKGYTGGTIVKWI